MMIINAANRVFISVYTQQCGQYYMMLNQKLPKITGQPYDLRSSSTNK